MPVLIKRFRSVLILLPLILLLSCDKSQDPPAPPPPPVDTTVHVSTLTIDPAQMVLITTLSRQLTVNVLPNNAANKQVTWSSSDVSVATVNANGLVTAIKTGTADIIAASKENNSIKATVKLTVLKSYDVYAVGKGSTSDWNNCAVYWKNGVRSGLSGGHSVGSEAFAIMFSGNDEYIAGNTLNEGLWTIPTYWKNGTPHIVGDKSAQYASYSRAIAINGGKVYLAGYSFYNSECPDYCFGRSRARYFTDNAGSVSQTDLFNSASSTVAYGIIIKGNDVFVAGAQSNNNMHRWSTLWKNNVTNVDVLSPVTGFYEASAISQLGDDIYIAANGGCGDYGCKATAYLLKNNMNSSISLTDGSNDAKAFCMVISGNTIYVGGYEKNAAGKNVAKYWKIVGGTVSARLLSDGTKASQVNGITVSGSDVFLIGSEVSDTGERKAKCWRAYEGVDAASSIDVSDYYVSGGYEGYGISIR